VLIARGVQWWTGQAARRNWDSDVGWGVPRRSASGSLRPKPSTLAGTLAEDKRHAETDSHNMVTATATNCP